MTTKLYFILFLFSGILFSQEVEITGLVTDEATGQPVPGVNILVKNTTIGTSTDFDGNYSLSKVPVGSILVFTYIGYQNKEVTVATETVINVAMSEDTEALDEVVVIGYGTQKKRDITGSVSIVSSENIGRI